MSVRTRDDAQAIFDLGTSTIWEASDQDYAADEGIVQAWPGARVAGPAHTARCGVGDNLPIHAALETAPRGCVLVVETTGAVRGYWGEVLTRAAQTRGVAGLIIDGGVRDIDALERLQFPVFARGRSMRGTGKATGAGVGGPVAIGRLTVHPGDLVVADSDGVLVLPTDVVDDVLCAAAARAHKEQTSMARLDAGESTIDIYGWRELVTRTRGDAPTMEENA